jgi:hypothetical protein
LGDVQDARDRGESRGHAAPPDQPTFAQLGTHIHAGRAPIGAYRNRWLDALLLPPGPGGAGQQITAVITFGTLAKGAYRQWADTQPDAAAGLYWAAVRHPAYPESASAAGSTTLAGASTEPRALHY